MRTSLILLASASVFALSSAAMSQVQTAANQPAANGKPTRGPVVIEEVSILATIDGVTQTSEVIWSLCPTGTALVGGGHRIVSGVEDLTLKTTGPFSGGANGWLVEATVPSGKSASFRAISYCLQP